MVIDLSVAATIGAKEAEIDCNHACSSDLTAVVAKHEPSCVLQDMDCSDGSIISEDNEYGNFSDDDDDLKGNGVCLL